MFDMWRETDDIPVYTKFYFFSISNAEQVLHAHAKPFLIQKGPYVFRYIEGFLSYKTELDTWN